MPTQQLKPVTQLSDREVMEELVLSLRALTGHVGAEYVSEANAAATLGIHPRTLRRHVKSGTGCAGAVRFSCPTGRAYQYHAGDIIKLKTDNSSE